MQLRGVASATEPFVAVGLCGRFGQAAAGFEDIGNAAEGSGEARGMVTNAVGLAWSRKALFLADVFEL